MRGDGYQIETIPRERSVVMDGLSVGVRRHMVHALVEIDVTRARDARADAAQTSRVAPGNTQEVRPR